MVEVSTCILATVYPVSSERYVIRCMVPVNEATWPPADVDARG